VTATLQQRAWEAASGVVDPEIPVLTIADLGVLRDVTVTDAGVDVSITPTYSGCPAMGMIAVEVELALARAGIAGRVLTVLSPAWTTDWLTAEGRRKLLEYGIAPPPPAGTRRALFGDDAAPSCPLCGSEKTEKLSEFGSTSCKSLWRCRACAEPFDQFKCH
jgi:ring-1,2-phenylacetyl-CoA epoxidase subunit PaaD